jgi:hypothetical protein
VEPEVDLVITIRAHGILLEVKYRQYIDRPRDTLGVWAFIEKTAFNAPFVVLVTLSDEISTADPRCPAIVVAVVDEMALQLDAHKDKSRCVFSSQEPSRLRETQQPGRQVQIDSMKRQVEELNVGHW